MGKRSDFARIERDFYSTPAAAIPPLLRHLGPSVAFIEPCAGDGALIDLLEAAGHRCGGARDIEPRRDDIESGDALQLTRTDLGLRWEIMITNPPWTRATLHQLIMHLSNLGPV